MIIELSCPIFKNINESIYIPTEVAYVIFKNNVITETYSSRIKYNLNRYPKYQWEDMFHFYVSKYPAVFRTKAFYEKYDLYDFNIKKEYTSKLKEHETKLFYSDKYGIDAKKLKTFLINKIKNEHLAVFAKSPTRLNHFLDVENNNILIIDLKNLGIPKYNNLDDKTKINIINKFNKYNTFFYNDNVFTKDIIFENDVVKRLVECELPIYKVIIFYDIFINYINYSPMVSPRKEINGLVI